MKDKIRQMLIEAGVKNLKEFGYPNVTADNILTDMVFSQFFKEMLADNKGKSNKEVDAVIDHLIIEISTQNEHRKAD